MLAGTYSEQIVIGQGHSNCPFPSDDLPQM